MEPKISMKIAFFGAYGAFDFFKIGGCESYARRLATGLRAKGYQVDYVVYGAPAAEHRITPSGINLYYFPKLQDAVHTLAKEYDHVLTMYLHPADRLRYLSYRHLYRRRLRFHQCHFSWPDSIMKRRAMFLDARLYPFNGRLFCVSLRQLAYIRRWSERCELLLPPVPENYFLAPPAKPQTDKIRVTYIGRTEPGKGIEDVLALFNLLKDLPEIDIELHGFHHRQSDISIKIHEWLSHQDKIRYFYTPLESYSSKVDDNARHVLQNTDILLLPYQKLSSTIDMPLLLLEGMASLCAVVTRAFGDIPTIYGSSPFLLGQRDEITTIAPQILKARECIHEERERIWRRTRELGFGLDQTVSRLAQVLA